MKKQKNNLTASLFRIILSILLLASAAVAGGGFIYVQGMLKKYAIEVSHKKVDAAASDGNIQTLDRIKAELADNKSIIQKAQALKATNELPQFTIVKNVTTIAENNNLKITQFDFADSTQAAPAANTPATTQTQTAQTPVGGTGLTGSSYISISVTLGTPVNYADYLQFIHDIEQSVPKMQIQAVSLTPAESSNSVTVEPLTIQMYTR